MSLDLRCNNYTICNECYILFCDAISDPGNSLYTVVIPLAKGRTLQASSPSIWKQLVRSTTTFHGSTFAVVVAIAGEDTCVLLAAMPLAKAASPAAASSRATCRLEQGRLPL
jgi:hypothetical protein